MEGSLLTKTATLGLAALALAPCLAAADDDHHEHDRGGRSYDVETLVSDGSMPARVVDANLVNAWGIAINPQAVAWIADNGTGKSTLYDGSGKAAPLVVTIPPGPGETVGSPTGIVFSGGMDFVVHGTTPLGAAAMGAARFIFVTESGQIDAWAPDVNPATAFLAVDRSAGGASNRAIYKGVALGGNGTTHLLYAADFHNARIDVFDGTFAPVALEPGAFEDPFVPKGFAPFNVQVINGDVYVAYAKQDDDAEDEVAGRGLGLVAIFDPSGKLVKRLWEREVLNAPWGFALAPQSFGRFAGALLVGNFGDGTINAFSPVSGHLLGTLRDARGERIHIDGLWGIQFGNGVLGLETNALFAAAGPGDEEHGSFSVIRPHDGPPGRHMGEPPASQTDDDK
jgi:uncharacterized protein (TIGR03118 family)